MQPDDLVRSLFSRLRVPKAVASELFKKWFDKREFKKNKTSSKEKWEKLEKILVDELGRDELKDEMDNALDRITS